MKLHYGVTALACAWACMRSLRRATLKGTATNVTTGKPAAGDEEIVLWGTGFGPTGIEI